MTTEYSDFNSKSVWLIQVHLFVWNLLQFYNCGWSFLCMFNYKDFKLFILFKTYLCLSFYKYLFLLDSCTTFKANAWRCLIVSRICWPTLNTKLLNFENSKSVLIFSSFGDCWVISKFVIFHKMKVAKHIWNTCGHLAAEGGSYFIPTRCWWYQPQQGEEICMQWQIFICLLKLKPTDSLWSCFYNF